MAFLWQCTKMVFPFNFIIFSSWKNSKKKLSFRGRQVFLWQFLRFANYDRCIANSKEERYLDLWNEWVMCTSKLAGFGHDSELQSLACQCLPTSLKEKKNLCSRSLNWQQKWHFCQRWQWKKEPQNICKVFCLFIIFRWYMSKL